MRLFGIQCEAEYRNPAQKLLWTAALSSHVLSGFSGWTSSHPSLFQSCWNFSSRINLPFIWKAVPVGSHHNWGPFLSPHFPHPCANLHPTFFGWLSLIFLKQNRFGDLDSSFPSLEWCELTLPEVNFISQAKRMLQYQLTIVYILATDILFGAFVATVNKSGFCHFLFFYLELFVICNSTSWLSRDKKQNLHSW